MKRTQNPPPHQGDGVDIDPRDAETARAVLAFEDRPENGWACSEVFRETLGRMEAETTHEGRRRALDAHLKLMGDDYADAFEAAMKAAGSQGDAPPSIEADRNGATGEGDQAPRFDGGRVAVVERNANLDAMLANYPRTDLGNAERIAARFGDDVRYCHKWGKWLVWDGRRFVVDAAGAIKQRAAETVRAVLHEAAMVGDSAECKAHLAWQRASESKARIEAAIGLAESIEGIPVDVDDLDKDGWLLNCLNGTIDLRTRELRPHDRRDLITQLCPVGYDPDAECPLWEKTLNLFFDGDQSLIDFMRRLLGYALTGVVHEAILPFAVGSGANGKSTILGAVLGVMGSDYAMQADPSLITAGKDRHPTELADLFGKRFVVTSETQEGAKLSEATAKRLTGGDSIRARRIRENTFEFEPTHKIAIQTNDLPEITGTDKGIWRRVVVIPFGVFLPAEKQDPTIPRRLKDEYPGILAWLVRGCLEW